MSHAILGVWAIMQLKVRIWLADEDGRGFLGQGRYSLLRQIERTGSLQQAAKDLDLSYRKAWGDIRAVERQLGFEMVTRKRGGPGGGASSLTDRAKRLLDAYGKAIADTEACTARQYEKRLKKLLPRTGKPRAKG